MGSEVAAPPRTSLIDEPAKPEAQATDEQRFLRNVVVTLVSTKHPDFEDCLQEAWVALEKSRETCQSASDPVAYAVVTVRNAVIDYLRKRHRECQRTVPLEDATDIPDESPENDPEWCLQRQVLRFLVARLPEFERRVIERRYGFDGARQTQRALAEALGVSERTVRRAEHSALRRLRAVYTSDALK